MNSLSPDPSTAYGKLANCLSSTSLSVRRSEKGISMIGPVFNPLKIVRRSPYKTLTGMIFDPPAPGAL